MSNHRNEQYSPQRRDFLRILSSGAIALAAGEVLAGCGGGGSIGGNGVRSVAGTVDLGVIGGNGLAVQSVHQVNGAVDVKGTFATKSAASGAQILCVTDAAGKLRALSIANPTLRSGLPFNANTTAATLVFLTPGIMTTDPIEAAGVVAKIQTLPSFPALVDFLTRNLSSTSLTDLAKQPSLDPLKGNCIQDYLSVTGRGNEKPGTRDATQGQFNVTLTGTSNPANVKLSNAGWRWVNVARQALDANGKELDLKQQALALLSDGGGLMNGAERIGIGSWFFKTAGDPTVIPQAVDFKTPANVASFTYWVQGIGFSKGSETPPTDIDFGTNAIGLSLLFYLIFPFLAVLSGATEELTFTSINDSIFEVLIPLGSATKDAVTACTNGDIAAAKAAALDCLTTSVEIATTIVAAFNSIGMLLNLAALASPLALLLGIVDGALGLANASIAVGSWAGYPYISSIKVPVSSAGVTVQ